MFNTERELNSNAEQQQEEEERTTLKHTLFQNKMTKQLRLL